MGCTEFVAAAVDDLSLHGCSWSPAAPADAPDTDPSRAVVVIVHGMAERCRRYASFAEELAAAGFATYAYDQRGHGRTAVANGRPLGHLADRAGWPLLLADLDEVVRTASARHPGRPVFLFGHSMGSLVVRAYLQTHGDDLAGAVLCGTAGDPGPSRWAGLALARSEAALRGRQARSSTLDRLLFGSFNRPFEQGLPPEQVTGFEWLSTLSREVSAYVADPWCGFVCTTQFYADLLAGIGPVHDRARVSGMPPWLPILLIAGSDDPVGDAWRGVLQTKQLLRDSGVRDVRSQLYRGARHEILNDRCRDRVVRDVLAWLDEQAGATPLNPDGRAGVGS
ncbi:Lysophospholipase, alpha-beta hydrolase superfamily [Austwickia chelonae]|uniref:Putative hydrolase n=1 Tax=Austwickia chelonae NBRC 105200 TaxID=1184607 RepID=K6V8Y3_9MICO|nr:alpha/beta hydrolase [Austwickia chelonae]GAB78683.1 putative hydrolase [Austwickia chelonae NBRC 105200]SEW34691.1 Lysophospholipase, alpha-beta hydrolase superfamily [Austwickia chelonae]